MLRAPSQRTFEQGGERRTGSKRERREKGTETEEHGNEEGSKKVKVKVQEKGVLDGRKRSALKGRAAAAEMLGVFGRPPVTRHA